MNANRSGELVTPDSVVQEIGGNRDITFGGSGISGGAPVAGTHVRVMELRRVLCEVTSLESFKVRPSNPSSGLDSSIMIKLNCTIDVREDSSSRV
jgi:hypothetical protein